MREKSPNLVSTIIPVHNRPEMLKAAVSSVLGQSYRPIEIIIVDDGSTDQTASVAAGFAQKYPDIVRFLSQENTGPGPARENGRRIAKGEFIQYLDSDDRLMPDKFSEQVTALRENPDCGVAYGITRLVNQSGLLLVEPFKWTGEKIPQLFPALLVDRWWCTHTPLYRRSICDLVGTWSDLRYSQDWEYDARVGALRTRLVSTRTVVSEHFVHSEARQTGDRWLDPIDQLRFFESLYSSACSAGVEKDSKEMQHFSRWVFTQARKCGATGQSELAQKLLELATQCSQVSDLKMQIFAVAARIIGWTAVGWMSKVIEKFSPGPSQKTQMFSWKTLPENKKV